MSNDLYTRVAERHGVDRTVVKNLALPFVYQVGGPGSEEELERALDRAVQLYKAAAAKS